VLAFIREHGRVRFLVALNFGHEPATLPLDRGVRGEIALSTHLDREAEPVGETIELRGDEGVVLYLR
jgi:alpha-glucosidase